MKELNTPGKKEDESFKAIFYPACSGCGLGCLGTFILGILAVSVGICLNPFDFSPFGGILGFIAILITSIAFRSRQKNVPWRVYCAEIAAIAVLLASLFAWDTPRYLFETYFVSPKPKTVLIKHTQWEPHPMDPTVRMHFSATPETISTIIATNRLELRAEDISLVRPRENDQPSWWQPNRLGRGARLYKHDFCDPVNTNYVRYVIGLWVNEQHTEAYGYYISY